MSGRYASYWNAFLSGIFLQKMVSTPTLGAGAPPLLSLFILRINERLFLFFLYFCLNGIIGIICTHVQKKKKKKK